MTLAICGTIKYGSVEQMNLAQRVEGIIENFLATRTSSLSCSRSSRRRRRASTRRPSRCPASRRRPPPS